MNIRKIHAVDYNDCAKNLVAAYAGPPWNNSRGYVVEEKGKIIAMCLGRIDYYFSGLNQFCIDEFNVIPSQQKLGIGKQLISYVSDAMKRENINTIFLITGGELSSKFYEKNGFIKTTDGIMMELVL